MIDLITLGGNTVSVVSLPTAPGFQSIQFNFSNAVAAVNSIFTGQTQVQTWPGADSWSGTATLPPLTIAQRAAWTAGLMQCGGMQNAFQLGDPQREAPTGSALGTPTVDGTIPVVPGGIQLPTMGWQASTSGLLLIGDYLQVGYRLHVVLDTVTSDANGKALINIWPSLRDPLVGGEAITTTNPVGLFRLAKNHNSFSVDQTRLSHLSFDFLEYR